MRKPPMLQGNAGHEPAPAELAGVWLYELSQIFLIQDAMVICRMVRVNPLASDAGRPVGGN